MATHGGDEVPRLGDAVGPVVEEVIRPRQQPGGRRRVDPWGICPIHDAASLGGLGIHECTTAAGHRCHRGGAIPMAHVDATGASGGVRSGGDRRPDSERVDRVESERPQADGRCAPTARRGRARNVKARDPGEGRGQTQRDRDQEQTGDPAAVGRAGSAVGGGRDPGWDAGRHRVPRGHQRPGRDTGHEGLVALPRAVGGPWSSSRTMAVASCSGHGTHGPRSPADRGRVTCRPCVPRSGRPPPDRSSPRRRFGSCRRRHPPARPTPGSGPGPTALA